MEEQPRKVDPESIEIIGAQGEVVKEAKDHPRSRSTPFGNIKVFQGGPWMLFLIPVLIPIAIVAFFFLSILALLFGRTVFKLATRGVRRS